MNRDEFKEFLIDPSVDYRRELSRFRVNGRGDLLFMQNNRWEIMISHERLTECDWISHMVGKSYVTFGDIWRVCCCVPEGFGTCRNPKSEYRGLWL